MAKSHRTRPDLFVSLPREEFEKLELITQEQLQQALDRGRPDTMSDATLMAAHVDPTGRFF